MNGCKSLNKITGVKYVDIKVSFILAKTVAVLDWEFGQPIFPEIVRPIG